MTTAAITLETTDRVGLATAYRLRGTAAIGWRWWALAGLLFGIATATVWRGTASGAIFAAPPTILGVALAERVWRVVERPTRDGVVSFVALAGFTAPALTGILDLSLRYCTP
jgi:hypothetical protein